MAKKQEVEKVSPALCLRSLQSFHESVTMLTNIIPATIDYIRDNPSDNKTYQEHLIKLLEEHQETVKSFYN